MPLFPDLEKRAFLYFFLFLIILGIYIVYPFWLVIVLSVILAVLFYPLHKRFLKWTHGRRGLAASLSLLSVILLSVVPLGVFLTLITSQLAALLSKLPQSLSAEGVSGVLVHYEMYLKPLILKVEEFFGTKIQPVVLIKQSIQYLAQALAQYSPDVFLKTVNFFLNLFIMMILLFYLFRDGRDFFEKLIRISPIKDKYERSMAEEIQLTIYGVFYGSFLTALVQAAFATLGYYIARIPGALVFGAATFFTSFIPLVGTSVVLVPLVVFLLIKGSYGYAIFLAIYGILIIGSSDNLLKPLLIKGNIHQALLFLSLFGGLAVFGPMGLLLGPIIMAMLTAMVRIYERDYLGF